MDFYVTSTSKMLGIRTAKCAACLLAVLLILIVMLMGYSHQGQHIPLSFQVVGTSTNGIYFLILDMLYSLQGIQDCVYLEVAFSCF